ncbi:hypothetical protein ACKLNO_08890 [Neisseriaceae bacterium B1]
MLGKLKSYLEFQCSKRRYLKYFLPIYIALFTYIAFVSYDLYLRQSVFKRNEVQIKEITVQADIGFLSGTRGARSLMIRTPTIHSSQNCFAAYIRDFCDSVSALKNNQKNMPMTLRLLEITPNQHPEWKEYSVLSGDYRDKNGAIQVLKTQQQAAYSWFYYDKSWVFIYFVSLILALASLGLWIVVLMFGTKRNKSNIG